MSITCLQTRWLKLSKANSNPTRVEVRHSSHLEPTPHQPTHNPKLFTFNNFDNPLFGLNELFGLNSVENFRIRFKRILRLKSWIRFLIKGILKVNYSDSVKRNRNTVLDIFGSFYKKRIWSINYSYSYSFSYNPYSFEPQTLLQRKCVLVGNI